MSKIKYDGFYDRIGIGICLDILISIVIYLVIKQWP